MQMGVKKWILRKTSAVMSRKVLPVCGKLCYLCPGIRARSRQPVKRYKNILASIFPRSQDSEPNDRMIGKLCDYTSRNPARIPDITHYLEQKCFKELRNERLYLARVVPRIYGKLLSSCKEQMPLLAPSSLLVVQTLLDQRQDEMRILGCLLLVNFLTNQVDGAYMFSVEGIISRLCELGQDLRDDDRGLKLRSAALQALASMVQFMGDYSHVAMDFENIVLVIMENYRVVENPCGAESTSAQNQSTKEETLGASHNDPGYWSRVCLQNMAKLAKEATTVRHVIEPLFRYFDSSDCWSPESSIASSILSELQLFMDSSGQSSHLLLCITIKHLDHKSVAKRPLLQVNILKVANKLAQQVKLLASVHIISAIGDLVRHMRKCMQCAIEASEDDDSMPNSALHSALEACLLQLTKKVGDVGPILDMLAVVLESISPTAIIARATIASIYRTVRIAASLPNLSYDKKVLPESLFQQLLLAMAHPDYETRIGSHRILSATLFPLLKFPWSVFEPPVPLSVYDPKGTRLVALSAISSLSVITEKIAENCSASNEKLETNKVLDEDCDKRSTSGIEIQETKSMLLSSQQVGLLLSSIWNQALSEENKPANYEAMAHTFNLALQFSKTQDSNNLVRCFQLAFSLRSISLDPGVLLQASRKRSLYTMATAMLMFSAKASHLPQIIAFIKESTSGQSVNLHLSLIEDNSLELTFLSSSTSTVIYGSEEDEGSASDFLSILHKDDKQLRDAVILQLVERLENFPEDILKEQMFQQFSPEESFLLRAQLFMETAAHPCSPYTLKGSLSEEELVPSVVGDEDTLFGESFSQSDTRISESIHSNDVLSVTKLLESVKESAQEVANAPLLMNPLSFDQMKDQCEALLLEKQQKLAALLSFNLDQDPLLEEKHMNEDPLNEVCCNTDSDSKDYLGEKENSLRCDSSSGSENSFRLPPSSPYDKFLKAAGW
ncbi:ARM repeat superfamily protein [Rhynchospora pubera]|uniref:ARM repeat superfamily protein n=1 Tax=Rhynchospora pubera TaxID=906938 RepID=A0AAV8C044_9POAL|nr:ARM repeat superfamily protein [Rhynchospora pubera]